MRQIIALIIFTFLFSSCAVSKNTNHQKDIFLTQFFDNDYIYTSLSEYYKGKVVIYDKEKLLVEVPKSFGTSTNNIKIETLKPPSENYFVVYSFILNKNLASLVLATSDMEKGIIYYIKRNSTDDKWTTMNIIPKNNR